MNGFFFVYRGVNAQTRELCARHNRWTQFSITTIIVVKKVMWWNYKTQCVVHNDNVNNNDG